MSKTINWPKQFLEEVLSEDDVSLKIALRVGSLYFDTNYYSKEDIIDIRVEHEIVRQGIITDDLKLCKLGNLGDNLISCYKKDLNSVDKIIDFLSTNYNTNLNKDSVVTIIPYKNLKLNKQEYT